MSHLTYGIVNHSKCGLLVVMVHSTVTMKNRHPLLFTSFAIASIHAVIWPVVPLAWKYVQTLCRHKEKYSTFYPNCKQHSYAALVQRIFICILFVGVCSCASLLGLYHYSCQTSTTLAKCLTNLETLITAPVSICHTCSSQEKC